MPLTNAIHGLQRYWRSAITEELTDELIEVVVGEARDFSSPASALAFFFYLHGAATRVASTDTAFASRHPQWDFDAIGQWTDGGESAQHIAWVRAPTDAALAPQSGPPRIPPAARCSRVPRQCLTKPPRRH